MVGEGEREMARNMDVWPGHCGGPERWASLRPKWLRSPKMTESHSARHGSRKRTRGARSCWGIGFPRTRDKLPVLLPPVRESRTPPRRRRSRRGTPWFWLLPLIFVLLIVLLWFSFYRLVGGQGIVGLRTLTHFLLFICRCCQLQSVTLHTNLGDIKCEIACDEVPKTAEVCYFLSVFIRQFPCIISLFLTVYFARYFSFNRYLYLTLFSSVILRECLFRCSWNENFLGVLWSSTPLDKYKNIAHAMSFPVTISAGLCINENAKIWKFLCLHSGSWLLDNVVSHNWHGQACQCLISQSEKS